MSEQRFDTYEHKQGKLIKRTITGIMLGLAVMAGFIFWGDFGKVLNVMEGVSKSALVIAICLTLLSYGLRFVKWQLFLLRIGVTIPLKESAEIFFIGMSMSVTPGKVGEVLKSYLIKVRTNTSMWRTVPLVIVDRLTDMIAMLILISIGAIVFSFGIVSVVVVFIGIVVFIIVIQNEMFVIRVMKFCCRLRLLQKYEQRLIDFYKSTQQLMKIKPLLLFIFISVAAWLFEGIALYVLVQALELELTLLHSIFIFSLGTVAGALSMIPGGLGIAEGSMTGLFLFFGTDRTIAITLTLLIRIVTLWFGVFIGLFVFFRTKKRYLSE